jgi:hypothetical protein
MKWIAGVGAFAFAVAATALLRPAAGSAGAAGTDALVPPPEVQVAQPTPAPPPPQPQDHVEVPPPPFSEGIFPCSACHKELPVDRTRRELFAHDIALKHDEEHRWCLDCHDATDRDFLHLASGERVPFDESYRLCGQCHGEKYRDWRAGVHGRRVGEWNGAKKYLLCVHCHNPHEPRFKPIAPMPAPLRPVRAHR